MAVCKVEYFSEALRRFARFIAIIPNDLSMDMMNNNPHFSRPTKTLILLHGYTGSETEWLYNTPLRDLSCQYNLAILLPNGGNSFYLNGPQTGRKYSDFVGKELPEYAAQLFNLSSKRENTWIGGFSMGGFGALHTALAFPERFSKVIACSSALIQNSVAAMSPDTPEDMANYDYYRLVFGDPGKLPVSANNPEQLIRELQASGKEIPKIFFCVGTDDFVYELNQHFREFLSRQGIPFQYVEGPGTHSFTFVRSQLETAVQFLLEE